MVEIGRKVSFEFRNKKHTGIVLDSFMYGRIKIYRIKFENTEIFQIRLIPDTDGTKIKEIHNSVDFIVEK